MSDRFAHLSWENLRRTEGDLPWATLETFADAVVDNPDLAQELFAEYDKAWEAVDVPTYLDLYIPAIFALAAPRLDDRRRREIGDFLVDKLLQADAEGADLNEEILLAASGSMGPVILPRVLDELEATTDDAEADASSWAWNLTALADQTEDAALRDRTIRACVRLLEQTERGEVEEFWGVSAAWTLARLKYVDAGPLLQRLDEQFKDSYGDEAYGEAREFLQGQPGRVARDEPWQHPIRKWLESSWQAAQEWFARHDPADSEEEAEALFSQRVHELIDRFTASRQAADLPENVAEDVPHIAHTLLEYAYRYEGATAEELTKPVMEDLLFDVLPRKISAEREYFEKVPIVAEGFLRWLASEGILPEGQSTADAVRDWAKDSVAAAMDADNWGFAKQFTMGAIRTGVDVTDREAMQRYMLEQSQKTLARRARAVPDQAPIPIVEHAPKVGRNDPCPCGSGKKYKKCCGDPAQEQAAST
jgi:hypothetical protein